jgi:heterodisulfide reductase subunit A
MEKRRIRPGRMNILDVTTDKNSSERPVIVLLCRCEGEINGTIDLERVRDRLLAHPKVDAASIHDSLCSEEGRSQMREFCSKRGGKRVVIGACSPEVPENPLTEDLEEAGINGYLVAQVDIREQCAWVHPSGDPATAKATELVRGAIERSLKQEPLEDLTFDITGAALIIGRSELGARAAVKIAEAGFKVYLLDEEDSGSDTLAGHDDVEILTDCHIEGIDGIFGRRHVKVHTALGSRELEVGTILVVTPQERSCSDNPNLIAVAEFERLLIRWEEGMQVLRPSDGAPLRRIGFVQHVEDEEEAGRAGPRQSAFIALAITQALRLKRLHPDMEIDFYVHDAEGLLRTSKALSDSAARSGIRFNSLATPPEITTEEGKTIVRAEHLGHDESTHVERDLVVVVGDRTAPDIASRALQLLHAGTGEGIAEGDFAGRQAADLNKGVFVIRTSNSNEAAGRAANDAESVASAMVHLMHQKTVRVPRHVAHVQEYRCRGCGKCTSVCEHDAIKLVEKEKGEQVAQIDEMRCEGCGLCRVACCNGAMALLGYTTTQLLAQMLGMIEEVGD